MPKSNVGPTTLGGRIENAWDLRRPHLEGRVLDAWRLINGPADGAPPGLTIDRYGEWLVIAGRDGVPRADLEAWGHAACRVLGARGVVAKILRRPVKESTSEVLLGDPPPASLPIREDDVTLLCDLDDGLSTGLFLDQREVRRDVRAFARGVEVLNLFAYTGAFSLHAAKAGASRVTSVDSSRRALARGRDNMRASGLDSDLHRWFPDDVRTHLARGARRGDQYGLVILDPPVFGRAGSKVHVLSRELGELVSLACAVVAPGGILVVSVHALDVDSDTLSQAVRASGRSVEMVAEYGLPAWDHPTVADMRLDLDRGEYLKTLVARLG